MADYRSGVTKEQFEMIPDLINSVFPLTIGLSAHSDTPLTNEIGSSITPKAKFTATKKGVDVVNSSTISVFPSATVNKTSKVWTADAAITKDTEYTMTVNNEGSTKTAKLNWKFLWKKYYGVSANKTLTNAQILSLTGELSDTKTTSAKSFNCTGGKYPYFCCPASFGEPQFWVGGLRNTDIIKEEITLVNGSGASGDYVLYRLNELQNGVLSIEFK